MLSVETIISGAQVLGLLSNILTGVSYSTIVSSEASTRLSVDTSLSSVVSTHTSQVTSLSSSLSTEISTRGSSDTSLSTAIVSKADKDLTFFVTGGSYTLQSTDDNKFIQVSGTSTVTLPNSLSTGFQCVIINIGTNTITLSASTTLYTADSKVTITKQYGAVTVCHKGSNIWYGFGNLT